MINEKMSLFLKIFLWFWLAMALIVGAVTLVNWSTQSEPLARQWQTFVGEAVNLNSQTSAQIYESEGIEGLNAYLNRSSQAQRVNSVGFFDDKKNLIAGNLKSDEIKELFDKAMQSGQPEFLRLENKTYAAKKVTLKSGVNYIYVLELKRFQEPPFFTTRLLLQILTVVLTGGLVCYALAFYLTSPISKLRRATQKFAEGDLQTRVSEKVGKRGDELSKLAKDFDEMAERIEALVTAEKRLTQDISHELRSPLARLNVALELARVKANPETKTLLERIENESNRLNEMLSRLLTLSKLESGSGDFDKMEVNLTRLFNQVVSDADFEAQAKGKSVKVLKEDAVKVFGNENLLRSAIENVLRNAVKYTKDDTAVEVSLAKNGKSAIVSVRDHGAGVPDDELEKLFKPFYRLHTARDRKTGGIGLGLAIAERAVNAHNGEIKAKNTDDGLIVEIKVPYLES
jgi:two-component system sensor histidine kinase CpxA